MKRIDFWNVYGELTPYEFAVLRALYEVEPWGDDRADIRAAISTVAVVANVSMGGITEDTLQELHESLANYLDVNQPEQKVASGATVIDFVGM